MRDRYRYVMASFALALLGLGVAFALTVPPHRAAAQPMGFVNSARQESTPAGLVAKMWNATGTQINAGTVVMIDTVAASAGQQIPLGKGFKTWDATFGTAATNNYFRACGILMDNCPSYEARQVLIRGTYNTATMDASGIAALSRLRLSYVTAGALAAYAVADSASQVKSPVGIFQKYSSASATTAQVWVDFTGLVAGR